MSLQLALHAYSSAGLDQIYQLVNVQTSAAVLLQAHLALHHLVVLQVHPAHHRLVIVLLVVFGMVHFTHQIVDLALIINVQLEQEHQVVTQGCIQSEQDA